MSKESFQPSVNAHILTETVTGLQNVTTDPQTEQWPKGVSHRCKLYRRGGIFTIFDYK